MPEKITVRGEGITADLLLFRRYGARGQGLVEEMLDTNPGLAALGPVIPLGTEVILPDLSPIETAAARKIVSLFG